MALYAQTASDSVTFSVRRYAPSFPTVHWTGQFNNWNPTDPQWAMTYVGEYWITTRAFRIHTSPAPTPSLGDSVWQYKFTTTVNNVTTWVTDPLNPESNPNDHNNSILRLSSFFWFQFYAVELGDYFTRFTMCVAHSNADTIKSISLATGPTPAELTGFYDLTTHYSRATRILDFTLPSPVPKVHHLRFVAKNQRGDSIVYTRGGYVVQRMPMPSYVKHGVTLPSAASGDSTSFRLRVGGKDYVLLRIAPVGQPLATVTPIVMRKNVSSGGDWWINLKLDPGTYEYVYEIENGKMIYDPWGREHGEQGTRFTVGSAGLTADDYVWKSTSYRRPPLNRLVIYELHVGEFGGGYYGRSSSQPGTFRDLETLLPHLDSLGINAIELMPINDFGSVGRSGHSWGYDINSYFALEPAYGTPRELKSLIDAAHARGIAVIIDVVFNHLNETSPLWHMQPDEDANPYFKRTSDLRTNEDALFFFKDLDHWTTETQELVYESLKMWIDEYRVDGFRYDFTQGIGWTVADSTVGILGWANRIEREYQGSVYQIAEHLPESPALIYHSGLTSGWHDSFRDEVFNEARFQNRSMANIENLVLDLGAYQGNDIPSIPNRYASRIEPVNATVNHDEQSLIFEMTTFQSVPLDRAIQRDKLYGSLMFTSLGIPMLWQGMEFSEPRGWVNDGQKLTYRPVQWSLRGTERGKSHFAHYRTLILQRRFNPALFDGELRKLKRYDQERVLVYGFEDRQTNSRVMVVSNFSGVDRTVTNVPWLEGGEWFDVFDQSRMVLSDSLVASFQIPAYTARIYSNRSNASLGIPVSVPSVNESVPADFVLYQNFPNPFNPQTRIRFDIPRTADISLTVYSVLGEEILTLRRGVHAPGTYWIDWNGRDSKGEQVASGVYVLRLSAEQLVRTRKLLLIR